MEMCVKYKAPIVITSLGAKEWVNEAVHSYGGITLHDIINNRFAKKAVEKGADGLIAVASGAGGHAGTQSPFALIQEIREWFEGAPYTFRRYRYRRCRACCTGHGSRPRLYRLSVYRYRRSDADQGYKQAIVDCGADDIIYSNLFTGVHGNYLRPSIESAGLDPDNLPVSDPTQMNFGSGGNTDAKAWKDIWGSGQGIGAVKSLGSAADYVAKLAVQYDAAKARVMG